MDTRSFAFCRAVFISPFAAQGVADRGLWNGYIEFVQKEELHLVKV